jgi:hypothetical protein
MGWAFSTQRADEKCIRSTDCKPCRQEATLVTQRYEDNIKIKLTKECRQLKPCNSAQILQYNRRPSPDFLAKVCVNTQQFSCNTQFYFAISSSWVYKPYRCMHFCAAHNGSVSNMLAYSTGGLCSILTSFFLFLFLFGIMSIMALETIIFVLFS